MYTENRNSTLILYSSRGGTALAYAERLSGMRDCDIMEAKDAKLTQLRAYETIIWMGGVYAGRIEGLETLQKYHKNSLTSGWPSLPLVQRWMSLRRKSTCPVSLAKFRYSTAGGAGT